MGVCPEKSLQDQINPTHLGCDQFNWKEDKHTRVRCRWPHPVSLYNWTDGFKESERSCSNLCLSLSLSVHLSLFLSLSLSLCPSLSLPLFSLSARQASTLLAVRGLTVILISSLLQLWTQRFKALPLAASHIIHCRDTYLGIHHVFSQHCIPFSLLERASPFGTLWCRGGIETS